MTKEQRVRIEEKLSVATSLVLSAYVAYRDDGDEEVRPVVRQKLTEIEKLLKAVRQTIYSGKLQFERRGVPRGFA